MYSYLKQCASIKSLNDNIFHATVLRIGLDIHIVNFYKLFVNCLTMAIKTKPTVSLSERALSNLCCWRANTSTKPLKHILFAHNVFFHKQKILIKTHVFTWRDWLLQQNYVSITMDKQSIVWSWHWHSQYTTLHHAFTKIQNRTYLSNSSYII